MRPRRAPARGKAGVEAGRAAMSGNTMPTGPNFHNFETIADLRPVSAGNAPTSASYGGFCRSAGSIGELTAGIGE